jgi:hypothetical protein
MKVTGTGQPPSTPAAAEEGPVAPEKSERPGGVHGAEGEKAFAEKLAKSRAPESPAAASAPRVDELRVGDIAADLRSGRVTPSAAVEKVVERVMDRQVGPEAPAAVRDQIRAALQDALETDPLLAEKLRGLQ